MGELRAPGRATSDSQGCLLGTRSRHCRSRPLLLDFSRAGRRAVAQRRQHRWQTTSLAASRRRCSAARRRPLLPPARSRRRGVWRRCHTLGVRPGIHEPPRRHSGYHMRSRRRGFEGWYHRLSLPNSADFAFIYSVPIHGRRLRAHDVGADPQPDDTRVERTSPADGFGPTSTRSRSATRRAAYRCGGRPRLAAFARFVEGFQFTSTRHQGVYADELVVRGDAAARLGRRRRSAVLDGGLARRGARLRSALPGADGARPGERPRLLARRALRLRRRDRVFEKNWGDKFPALVLDGVQHGLVGSGVITLTVAGGRRAVPVVGEEDVAMIALHGSRPGRRDGQIPAVPQRRVADGPMGPVARQWRVRRLRCLVEATYGDAGVSVRVPTAAGMVEGSRESFAGALRVRVWRDGEQDAPLIDAASTRRARARRCAVGRAVGGVVRGARRRAHGAQRGRAARRRARVDPRALTSDH